MPYSTSRRQFLIQSSILLTSTILPPLSFANSTNDEILLGGCRYLDKVEKIEKYALTRIAPLKNTSQRAISHFFPHGLAFTGAGKKKAFAFEKIGTGAGLFDIEKMQLEQTISPVKGRLFYGHGVCSLDDKLLFSTETSASGDGAIGIRETGSLRYIGDFPTYGQHPHECHLVEQGKVLAVTNGGGSQASGNRPSICYIDIESQKLLERIEMPDDRFNAGHMFPLEGNKSKHQAILISAPRRDLGDEHLGSISVRLKSNHLKVIIKPEEIVDNMFGEALSVVAIPSINMFVVTHPKPGMVTFWQLTTQKLLKRLDLPHARGVALTRNQKNIWISYGTDALLAQVNLSDFSIVSTTRDTFITGSHLFPT